MPSRQMERAIALWREGERQIEALPMGSADHAAVTRAVGELKSAHASLFGTQDVSADLLARATEMIDDAELTIVATRVWLEHP